MRHFLILFAICLMGMNVQAGDTDTSEGQDAKPGFQSVRPTLYLELEPPKVEGNSRTKSKKKQREYKERQAAAAKDRIQTLLKLRASEWETFARELQCVSALRQLPNIDDRRPGEIKLIRAKALILGHLVDCAPGLISPLKQAGYMVFRNSIKDEQKEKLMLLRQLEVELDKDKPEIDFCLRIANACFEWGRTIPTDEVPVSQTVAILLRAARQKESNSAIRSTLQEIYEAGMQDKIPSGFFELYRQHYFQKAAYFFYMARRLSLCKLEEQHPEKVSALNQGLSFEEVVKLFTWIHTRSSGEQAWTGEHFALSLLLKKVVFEAYHSLCDMNSVSVSKSRGKGKSKGKDQKQKDILTIHSLLKQQADELRTSERNVEAEYRESAAFLIRTLLYKGDKPRNDAVTIMSRKKIDDIQSTMEKINEVKGVLDSVSHIEVPIQGYEALKQIHLELLLKLCLRLHMPEFAEVSDETKFWYYQQFHMLQEEGYLVGFKSTNDYIRAIIFDGAACVAPDQATETEFYQLAGECLPPTEGLDLWRYYIDKYDLENNDLADSNTQRKKLKVRDISEHLVKRGLAHIRILIQLGRQAEVNSILETLETNIKEEQEKKCKAKRNKYLTHSQLVKRIRAEQENREAQRAAEEKLKQEIAEQASALEELEAQETPPLHWNTLPEGGERQSQAEIRKELREADEQRKAKKNRKDRATHAEVVGPASKLEEGGAQTTEVTRDISPFVRETLKVHRATFEALFTRHDEEGAYNNAVSVQRDHFLRMILALGGTHSCSQGSGSHQFVRLVLGDQVVDMEALPNDLADELERSIAESHSHGTMTLSWPKKDRGRNRRFLLPEQIKNARLVLASNGLTPELVFEDEGPADEDVQ